MPFMHFFGAELGYEEAPRQWPEWRCVCRRVAWNDPAGQWNVFLDVCPHRLVPLSEGRINEDGRLVGCGMLLYQSFTSSAQVCACSSLNLCNIQ